MRLAPDGNGLVPTYPVGFPLLVIAATPLAGWEHAADLTLVLHSIAGLLLTWGLARALGLSRRWSMVATAIMAASPLYLFFSLRAMSDLPAMVWTTAAVLAAWRSRESASWALLAGAALSLAVLIRPTNILAALPVAVAVVPSAGGPIPAIRRLGLVLLGAVPGAAFFCIHSRIAYGHYLATGYGDISADFGGTWVGMNLATYGQWLPVLFTPVVVFVFALPWVARSAPRAAAVLGIWILGYGVFYSVYRFTHDAWWYLRFLLPIAPALVVGGLLGLNRVLGQAADRLPARLAFAASLVAVGAAGGFWTYKLHVFKDIRKEIAYNHAAAWLGAHVPNNAVILTMQTSGALFFDTNYTLLRWDSIDAGNNGEVLGALKASNRPLYAALFPFENVPALERVPGHWTKLKNMDPVTFWRRDGP
jgi:4-amino-4-deoxy-L-arabinose transferase-like glycosyltransferase